jgi:hypothetical protein
LSSSRRRSTSIGVSEVCTSTTRASAWHSHIASHRGDSGMSSSTGGSTPQCTWYASQGALANRQRRVVEHVAINK